MGLTLACALAAQKVEVRVVDRAARPATTSRANILHARGVEVLARLDALGDLPERSLAPLGMTMHVGDRPLATVRFAPLRGQSTQALFVSQADVEEQLRRRLGALGVEVEWNRPLDGLEVHEHGVTAHLDAPDCTPTGWSAATARTARSATWPRSTFPASPSASVSCSPTSTSTGTAAATSRRAGCTATAS